MKKPVNLWQWVGWRMGVIAGGAVVLVCVIMWLQFFWWQLQVTSRIPPAAQAQVQRLIERPAGHEAEIWDYLTRYYDVEDVFPGISGTEWWTVALLVVAALPIVFVTGFLLLRPLSSRFREISQAARRVAQGDLNIQLPIIEHMPLEVQQLTSDFNTMTQRLRLYEREVQESSAVLAHELRTPLNAAMGRVQGMLDEVFPANTDQLGLVLHQLENLNVMVDDLLLLSLAQAGQLPLNSTTFTLQALLSERLKWFSPQLTAVGTQVAISKLPIVSIHADWNRIGQVFNILLENYLRYAAAGGKLDIQGQAHNDHLSLAFCDRGPGLSEDEAQRVFERFWRQETSRNRRAGGCGLGLSIAHAICSAHGGAISARRRLGGGMIFEIRLPIGRVIGSVSTTQGA
ncbi:sensor histidine kinase [Pseudomonas sp. NPDC090592]|uniref:sensor histidine kinase n=1 Tax=Pseudomonas sp. NPDC090592 TaxID=3364480 RepID=UPI00383B7435